jgi:hypothetical protein
LALDPLLHGRPTGIAATATRSEVTYPRTL